MPIPGTTEMGGTGSHSSAFAIRLDSSSFVTKCSTADDARNLVTGSIVGDRHGGLTFSDEVAAILEARSHAGWREIEIAPGERWTVIVVNY